MSIAGDIKELRFSIRKNIDLLKSPILQKRLFDLYRSGKFGEMKSYVARLLQHPATPYSPLFRLIGDYKRRRDIKKIEEELEGELKKIKKASEKLEKMKEEGKLE